MRTILHTRFAVGLTGLLLLITGCLHAAPLAVHVALVAQVEQKLMEEHPDNPIKQVPFDVDHLTNVIRDRIDADLLKDNPHTDATDLQITRPYQQHAVAVMTLTYPTVAIALRQSERLTTFTHLRNTKILTPFTYGVVGETLVILFTESGQYDVISAFADMLNAQSAANPSPP